MMLAYNTYIYVLARAYNKVLCAYSKVTYDLSATPIIADDRFITYILHQRRAKFRFI